MELKQRLYDVDDLWEYGLREEYRDKDYELIDGVIIEMTKPGTRHGQLVIRLGRYLDIFVEENDLGIVTTETGYFPQDYRFMMLAPDVAYVSRARQPESDPDKWMPIMPDLAVEIHSPTNTYKELREKAQLYLRHGSKLVWIIMPAKQSVEIHRPQIPPETLAFEDSLSGDDVLPGFELALRRLFH
ncbi:MAG: Uma2 family endonuclease [Chloroflexota bacterium]|nr:Uma2 family endonuclease [Chloroflexota bacterium]